MKNKPIDATFIIIIALVCAYICVMAAWCSDISSKVDELIKQFNKVAEIINSLDVILGGLQ